VPGLVLDEAGGDADEGAAAVGEGLEVHRQEPARRGEHVRVDGELVVLVDRLVGEDGGEGAAREVARVLAGLDDVARGVVDLVAVVGVDQATEDAFVEFLDAGGR
jgi:hypothetical protein